MKNILPMLMCLALFSTAAMSKNIAGAGPLVTQNRYHSGFTAISSNLDATIVYIQGASYSIAVSGQQNILDNVSTSMRGAELVLDYSNNGNFGRHQPVTITITAPEVTSFTLNGSGDLRASELRAPGRNLMLRVNSSGSIYLGYISVGSVDGNVWGQGAINIAEGMANNEVSKVTGNGSIDYHNVHFPNSRTLSARYGAADVWRNNNTESDRSWNGNSYNQRLSGYNLGTHYNGAVNYEQMNVR